MLALPVVLAWSGTVFAQSDRELAVTAFDERDYRMAVVHYQRALQESPDSSELYAALAVSYER